MLPRGGNIPHGEGSYQRPEALETAKQRFTALATCLRKHTKDTHKMCSQRHHITTVVSGSKTPCSMKSWTASGPDMIHTSWLKKVTALHERLTAHLAAQMDRTHMEQLTQGRTVLIVKACKDM